MRNIQKVPIRKEGENKLPGSGLFGEHTVLDLPRDLNRLFGNFFSGFSLMPVTRWSEGTFLPKVNVTEDAKEVKVSAELPGLDEKDVEVSIAHGLLTIKGEKKTEKEDEGKDYYYLERSSGTFRRDIALSEGIDLDKAEALFKKGVLTVTLPKRPEAQETSKKIPVKNE